jgi:hypothetical protein
MFHAADRVLVGVMTQPQDLQIAQDEGWYRIPEAHAPACTTDAAVLALYFTAKFGDERWAIHWYAEIRGYELVRRIDLLPGQVDHPRANERYYKMQIGPLIRREPPIPSLRWRRISFIQTTWDRFSAAEEINDLYMSGADGLYVTLKESGFFPEREYLIREGDRDYMADLVIPCADGLVSVFWGEDQGPAGALVNPETSEVLAAVRRLGGPKTLSSTSS